MIGIYNLVFWGLAPRLSDKRVLYRMKRKGLVLEIEADIIESGILVAPKDGRMLKTIKEGLSGRVRVKLVKADGSVIYEETGYCAGVEIARD